MKHVSVYLLYKRGLFACIVDINSQLALQLTVKHGIVGFLSFGVVVK